MAGNQTVSIKTALLYNVSPTFRAPRAWIMPVKFPSTDRNRSLVPSGHKTHWVFVLCYSSSIKEYPFGKKILQAKQNMNE